MVMNAGLVKHDLVNQFSIEEIFPGNFLQVWALSSEIQILFLGADVADILKLRFSEL